MARRIREQQHEPEPLSEEQRYTPPAEPHVVQRFAGMDPRRASFSHPDTWSAAERQQYADEITEGMAAGWWDGLRQYGGGRR